MVRGKVGRSWVVNEEGDSISTSLELPGEGRIKGYIQDHREKVGEEIRKTKDSELLRALESVCPSKVPA